MRIKLPRPLNGWRAFAGEVGVVLLGVLLALGAQQAAEDIQIRSEVRELRRTIDHEIGLNLFIYDLRSRGSACNMRRIKELLSWVRKAQNGQALPQISIYGPPTMAPYRSAWDSRDGKVFAYVPAKARQKYAEFYDELDGNSKRLDEEAEAWLALKGFELPGPVSIDDRRRIYYNVAMAYSVDRTWAGNMPVSRKIADELGVKPIQPDGLTKEFLAGTDACEPIFVPKKATGSSAGAANR